MQDLARIKPFLELSHFDFPKNPACSFEKVLHLPDSSIPIPISQRQCGFNLEYLTDIKHVESLQKESVATNSQGNTVKLPVSNKFSLLRKLVTKKPHFKRTRKTRSMIRILDVISEQKYKDQGWLKLTEND